MRTTKPSPVAADSKPVTASEVEPAAQAANQPVATTDLIEGIDYDSSRRAAQHVAPGVRSTGAVPPAPPTYPTIAQHTAASVQGSSCLAYVQAAERAGTPVDMSYLQQMGADLLSAKIIAGELGVALNDKVVDAPAMSATSEGIAVSRQDAAQPGVAKRLIDRDARRPLCWMSPEKYWALRGEQQESLRPEKSFWREATGSIRYAARNTASALGWLRQSEADLLSAVSSGAGYFPCGFFSYSDKRRGEHSGFGLGITRELREDLAEEGILSESKGPSKVLSVTFLDEALGRIKKKSAHIHRYTNRDLCWLSEVIRLIYGEGQRRENQERLSRLEEQLFLLEKSVAGEGARQRLLPNAHDEAAALVRFAIHKTRATMNACVPPLAEVPECHSGFENMAIGGQVAELERVIDAWRDADTRSSQMRYRGVSPLPAVYIEPEWIAKLSEQMVDLRRRQFGPEDDAPPKRLAALEARLLKRKGQLIRWYQANGVTHPEDVFLSGDAEYMKLQDAIKTFARNASVDPESQLQRMKIRLKDRKEMFRKEKLAIGLDVGFVARLVRDNEELCNLQKEIDHLESCMK
jgi:hypothetical protein